VSLHGGGESVPDMDRLTGELRGCACRAGNSLALATERAWGIFRCSGENPPACPAKGTWVGAALRGTALAPGSISLLVEEEISDVRMARR
jgi:hypothetical protein